MVNYIYIICVTGIVIISQTKLWFLTPDTDCTRIICPKARITVCCTALKHSAAQCDVFATGVSIVCKCVKLKIT